MASATCLTLQWSQSVNDIQSGGLHNGRHSHIEISRDSTIPGSPTALLQSDIAESDIAESWLQYRYSYYTPVNTIF